MELENLISLIYYSIGILVISALHTEFHKREWPECRACRSHSYILSFIIGIIGFLVGIIDINLLDKLSHPYWTTFIMFALIGTFPLLPLYSIGMRPILISSKSLWIFSILIGAISSGNIILNRIFNDNPVLFKFIASPVVIGAIITGTIMFCGIPLAKLLSPEKISVSESDSRKKLILSSKSLAFSSEMSPISGHEILRKIWNSGEFYVTVSLGYIFAGVLLLIIRSLVSNGAYI